LAEVAEGFNKFGVGRATHRNTNAVALSCKATNDMPANEPRPAKDRNQLLAHDSLRRSQALVIEKSMPL
jgi:hypothetical protein